MDIKNSRGLFNMCTAVYVLILLIFGIAVVFASTCVGNSKTEVIPSPVHRPRLVNPSHTALLFVHKGSLARLTGNRLEKIGSGLIWPNENCAVDCEKVAVNWKKRELFSSLEGVEIDFCAEGPRGISAVVYRSSSEDILVIEPLGVVYTAYQIMAPDFSPKGWLAFSVKEGEGAPWRIWLWRPTFEGTYRVEFLQMFPPLKSGSDMVFPSFSGEEGDSRLVFSAREPSPEGPEWDTWDLWIAHYSTLQHRGYVQLTDVGNAIDPDWGPRGLVAYTTFGSDATVPDDFVFEGGDDVVNVNILDIQDGARWEVLPGQMPSWQNGWPKEQEAEYPAATVVPSPEPTPDVANCSDTSDLSSCCLVGRRVPEGAKKWKLNLGVFRETDEYYSGQETLTGEFSTSGFCRTEDDRWWKPQMSE